ncbi:MAG TPA: cytochrome c, partial [Pirellulales bacterium]|nr:cytochrome c [Pirellulales bacterium]
LYDTEHPLKTAAPALVEAAGKLAKSKDYAAAQAAFATVELALADKNNGGAAPTTTPAKVASMGQLMKQVTFVNSRLKRGLRRLGDKTDEKARDTAVLAAIAQAITYDTHEVKHDEQRDDWYRFCGEMRDAAGELNAQIKAADKQGAERALKRLGQSCEACHQVFRPEQK